MDRFDYESHREEDKRLGAQYEEYLHDMTQLAKVELNQMIGLLDRMPNYKQINIIGAIDNERVIAQQYRDTINDIVRGNPQELIVGAILQPILNALNEVDFNLEAIDEIIKEQNSKEGESSPSTQEA
jgi:hypothetical protein